MLDDFAEEGTLKAETFEISFAGSESKDAAIESIVGWSTFWILFWVGVVCGVAFLGELMETNDEDDDEDDENEKELKDDVEEDDVIDAKEQLEECCDQGGRGSDALACILCSWGGTTTHVKQTIKMQQ